MRYIVLLFFLVGCGEKMDLPEFVEDPHFTEYHAQFLYDMERFTGEVNNDLVYFYIDGEMTSIAKAHTFDNGFKYISVNATIWPNLSDNSKKTVIYHELAHALLGLDHSNEHGPIMGAGLNTTLIITDEHLSELFL